MATNDEKERIRSPTTRQNEKNLIVKTLNDLIKKRLVLAYETNYQAQADNAASPTAAEKAPQKLKQESDLLVCTIYERQADLVKKFKESTGTIQVEGTEGLAVYRKIYTQIQEEKQNRKSGGEGGVGGAGGVDDLEGVGGAEGAGHAGGGGWLSSLFSRKST